MANNAAETTLDIDGVGRTRIVRRNGIKSIRMRVVGYRSLRVSAPKRSSLTHIQHFVRRNQAWIESQTNWSRLLFIEGMQITPRKSLRLLHSQSLSESPGTLEVYLENGQEVDSLVVQQKIYDQVINHLRSEAKKYLPLQLQNLSDQTNLKYKKLYLKNITSRWGSYSSKHNINLAIQLMRLPTNLIDHVIIHELCHSLHLSHSSSFWDELSKVRPRYKEDKALLSDYELWRRPC